MPCGARSRAARSASSRSSPGMNRATDRRTKAVFVARSRSHALVEAARRTFRINDMGSRARAGTSSQDVPNRPAVDLDGGPCHVDGGLGQQERADASELVPFAVSAERN